MNKNMRKMYTEEEIVNLIKKAIQNGNIPIPSGTTLYVHYIDLDASGNSSCNILSSSKIPFTSTDNADFYQDDSIIKIMVNDDNQGLYTMAEYIDFTNGQWKDLNDGATYNINDYEFQEDVVEIL